MPNRQSPIVKTFQQKGVSFIAGPSGTAADCIEAVSFLCPTLTFEQWQDYLNLMAAAETGLGHHSLHEVMFTAVNAGVLPALKIGVQTPELWHRINYAQSYIDFLSNDLKGKDGFITFKKTYPQYFTTHPMVEKNDSVLGKRAKAAITIQRAIRARQAARHFQQAPFWKEIVDDEPQKSILLSFRNFVRELSARNVQRLKEQLGNWSKKERQFYYLFCSRDIALTHYTNARKAINKSGKLLSNYRLRQENIFFYDTSEADSDWLQNDKYIFFRMELIHKKKAFSRFGSSQFILKGRSSDFFKNGFVSLFDMYAPEKISISRFLNYKNSSVRIGEMDDNKNLKFRYNRKNIYPVAVDELVFYGQDIMQGIALAMIRELRRIGGAMADDFFTHFDDLLLKSKAGSDQFLTNKMNWMLSRLFRPEAKIPAVVYLSNNDHEWYQPKKIKEAIDEDNVFLLRQYVNLNNINVVGLDVSTHRYSPLHYTLYRGSHCCALWLLQQGADVNIQDSLQETALHYTVYANCTIWVRLLLAYNPNVLIKSRDNKTVMDLALHNKNREIIFLLLLYLEKKLKENKLPDKVCEQIALFAAYDVSLLDRLGLESRDNEILILVLILKRKSAFGYASERLKNHPAFIKAVNESNYFRRKIICNNIKAINATIQSLKNKALSNEFLDIKALLMQLFDRAILDDAKVIANAMDEILSCRKPSCQLKAILSKETSDLYQVLCQYQQQLPHSFKMTNNSGPSFNTRSKKRKREEERKEPAQCTRSKTRALQIGNSVYRFFQEDKDKPTNTEKSRSLDIYQFN